MAGSQAGCGRIDQSERDGDAVWRRDERGYIVDITLQPLLETVELTPVGLETQSNQSYAEITVLLVHPDSSFRLQSNYRLSQSHAEVPPAGFRFLMHDGALLRRSTS
jgi:hypothetical protein